MAQKVTDLRYDPRRPVFRVKMEQFAWADGETAAVVKPVPACGRVRVIIGTASNSENAVTYTTTIADEDGLVLYTKADWAEAATEKVQLSADTEVYVPPGCTMTVTPSGDPGSPVGTVDLVLIGA